MKNKSYSILNNMVKMITKRDFCNNYLEFLMARKSQKIIFVVLNFLLAFEYQNRKKYF